MTDEVLLYSWQLCQSHRPYLSPSTLIVNKKEKHLLLLTAYHLNYLTIQKKAPLRQSKQKISIEEGYPSIYL